MERRFPVPARKTARRTLWGASLAPLVLAVALVAALPAAAQAGGPIVAPHDGALDTGGAVRIVVALPRGGALVSAVVDSRPVGRRMRTAGANRLVAHVSGAKLGVGSHRLYVTVRDRRGRRRSAMDNFPRRAIECWSIHDTDTPIVVHPVVPPGTPVGGG
jgi:hypothetical protein